MDLVCNVPNRQVKSLTNITENTNCMITVLLGCKGLREIVFFNPLSPKGSPFDE